MKYDHNQAQDHFEQVKKFLELQKETHWIFVGENEKGMAIVGSSTIDKKYIVGMLECAKDKIIKDINDNFKVSSDPIMEMMNRLIAEASKLEAEHETKVKQVKN